MKTLAELKLDQETLPNRILAAAMDGDVQALGELERERASLPAALLHAELTELGAQLEDARSELVEATGAEREARAITAELQKAVKDAQRRLQLHQRTAGLAMNRTNAVKAEIRRLEGRISELAAEQAYFARAAAAAPVRNMMRSHIPGPARWPG